MDEQGALDVVELKLALRKEIGRSPELRFFHRLYCVLLVKKGNSSRDVADTFGEHPRTVERWVRRFEEKKFEGLQHSQRQGRHGSLNAVQREALRGDINWPPRALGYSSEKWGGKVLSIHIEQRYGIQLGVRQCQRLLKQLRGD